MSVFVFAHSKLVYNILISKYEHEMCSLYHNFFIYTAIANIFIFAVFIKTLILMF